MPTPAGSPSATPTHQIRLIPSVPAEETPKEGNLNRFRVKAVDLLKCTGIAGGYVLGTILVIGGFAAIIASAIAGILVNPLAFLGIGAGIGAMGFGVILICEAEKALSARDAKTEAAKPGRLPIEEANTALAVAQVKEDEEESSLKAKYADLEHTQLLSDMVQSLGSDTLDYLTPEAIGHRIQTLPQPVVVDGNGLIVGYSVITPFTNATKVNPLAEAVQAKFTPTKDAYFIEVTDVKPGIDATDAFCKLQRAINNKLPDQEAIVVFGTNVDQKPLNKMGFRELGTIDVLGATRLVFSDL